MNKRALNFNGTWASDTLYQQTKKEGHYILMAYLVLALCLATLLIYYRASAVKMERQIANQTAQASLEEYEALRENLEQNQTLLASMNTMDEAKANALFTDDELNLIKAMENETTKLISMQKTADQWLVTIRTQAGQNMITNEPPAIFNGCELLRVDDHYQYADLTYRMR